MYKLIYTKILFLGSYTQKLQETANSILETIKTGDLIVSTQNIVINGADEKNKKSPVSDLLAPLRKVWKLIYCGIVLTTHLIFCVKDKQTEWLDATVLVALSSSAKKPATLSHAHGNGSSFFFFHFY